MSNLEQPMKSVTATQFKNRCLAILEDVERTRRAVLVTRHGKPVARIGPVTPEAGAPPGNPLKNSIEHEGDLVSPIDDAWNASA
jgi:prevent-host-death family protein